MHCPFCQHDDPNNAPLCPKCGSLLPQSPNASADNQTWHTVQVQDAFTPEPPLRPAKHFSPALMFILSLLTCSLFGIIALLRHLDTLPREFPDQKRFRDVRFKLLVPFYNIVLIYFAWLELAERLERRLCQLDHPRSLPKRFLTATFLLLPIPFLNLVVLLLLPILATCFQRAINTIVTLEAAKEQLSCCDAS